MTAPELLTALRSAQAGLTTAPVTGWGAATDAELSELISLAASLRQSVERQVALGAGDRAAIDRRARFQRIRAAGRPPDRGGVPAGADGGDRS